MNVEDENHGGIFLAKTDTKSAFCFIPVLPQQRFLLTYKCTYPKTGQVAWFIEKCLPFGCSPSCVIFTLFSDSLCHIFEYMMGNHFLVNHYLDDYLFVQQEKETCNQMVRDFLQLCETIGCPISMEKMEWAMERIIFLGILLDGRHYRMCIPEDKKNKAIQLLNWTIQTKKVTIKHIQSLAGVLNFLNKAIVPGRAFTRGMYAELKMTGSDRNPLKQHHHVWLGKQFILDCKVWKRFLTEIPEVVLCRPFVDLDSFEYTHVLNFYTDAAVNFNNGGLGGIFNKRWIAKQWDKKFLQDCKPSIEFLELFALTTGILTWSHLLVNTRIVIFCDNTSVQDMVNSMATSCVQCRKLIRLLAWDGVVKNRRIFVRHVRSKLNSLADALSRNQMDEFWSKVPVGMNEKPDEIPKELWPVSKLWFANT